MTRRTVWKCAYQGGPTYVYPTLHDTEAEAEAHAKHLAKPKASEAQSSTPSNSRTDT